MSAYLADQGETKAVILSTRGDEQLCTMPAVVSFHDAEELRQLPNVNNPVAKAMQASAK